MIRAAALGAVVFVALLVSAWASMPAATPALTTLAAGTADAERTVAWGLALACVLPALGVCALLLAGAWWVAGCRRDATAWAERIVRQFPPTRSVVETTCYELTGGKTMWTQLWVRPSTYVSRAALASVDEVIQRVGGYFVGSPQGDGLPVAAADGTYEVRVLAGGSPLLVKGVLTQQYGLEIVREVAHAEDE